MQLVGKLVRFQQADDAALGHRIDLDQRARHAIEHLALEVGGEWRGSAVFQLQCGQVELVEARLAHQALVLDGYEHGNRGRVGLCAFEPADDVELAHHPHRAAGQQWRQEGDHGGVGIERRRGERAHRQAVLDPAARGGRKLAPAHLVRMDDALGHAGRAGGIDDVERIARLRNEFRRGHAFLRHPAVQFLVQHDPRHARKAVFAQLGQLGAVDEDMFRPRIARHARKLVGACAGGQRCRHAARAHGGEENQRIGDRRIAEDGDRLAALQPVLDQARGNPLDPVPELSPAKLALVIAHGDGVTQADSIVGDQLRKAAERFGKAGGDVGLSHAACVTQAIARV